VSPESGDDTWGKPLGERGELEREKRTLLKSIKEAEFDLAMGKLSKLDAEQLITMYRARAIEVIKALEEIDAGTAETPRQKIEREVAARLLIEQKGEKRGKKKAEDKKAETKKAAEAKQADKKAADAKPAAEEKPAETSSAAEDDKPVADKIEAAAAPSEDKKPAIAEEASS
jgi:hypothetical protein